MFVNLSIDGERRLLHSKLHSAGHLVDAIIARLGFISETEGLLPTKGHHFPDNPFVGKSIILGVP
jgi:hypothetical protein